MRPSEAVPLNDVRRIRYVLCIAMLDGRRVMAVADLIEAARRGGCDLGPEPAKRVSDALRTELVRGRAVRVSRGRYRFGTMPRGTEWWIRACLAEDGRHRRSVA